MEAGSCKITADIDFVLQFFILATNKRSDLAIWNKKYRKVMLSELIVPSEENFEQAQEQNVKRYKYLIEEPKE